MRIISGDALAALSARWLLAWLLLLIGGFQAAQASDNVLRKLDYSTLPGSQVKITLTLANPVEQPLSFETHHPARIVFDFMGTRSALSQRSLDIGIGAVDSVTTAETGSRTRVVIELTQTVPYATEVNGNKFQILLQPSTAMMAARSTGRSRAAQALTASTHRISDVSFRRTPEGAAKIVVDLSDPSILVGVHRESDQVIANFVNTKVPKRLRQRLDVTAFATPVQTVTTTQRDDSARIAITSSGIYNYTAYQANSTFTIEINPVSKAEQAQRMGMAHQYTGKRLSLNFQDIAVRSVLQLLADFTGLNMVVSDSVQGHITLRLHNVPWDQALNIILKTQGLGKQRIGNVLLVAPAEVIARRQRQALKTKRQMRQLAPLHTEFIRISYTKAKNLARIIRGAGQGGRSLLSKRGSVSVDPRTNTLIVRDTERNLDAIRRLVNKLDIPVRQVLIEARIVIANKDFSHALGVQFGYSRNTFGGDAQGFVVGGTLAGDTNFGGITAFESPAGSGNEGLLVDLPVTNPAGAIGLAIGKIGSYLLQLELSAMEREGRGKIVSSPRVITINQQEARIEQGVAIPYEKATSSGATSVAFKKAVLSLTVTPMITPDERILLDLKVTKDSIGELTPSGPAINTQTVSTQVLVDNGETVVLGGIYQRTKKHSVERVPFFGELPLIGWLFRNTTRVNDKSELLIFVTPTILNENIALYQ